ncbi:hypothetical protein P20495_0964 [Pseudoalteromonas sp. BSi20495]|nr:hypothetical protein P20495_0964 [Pseudoalteromonas sp. BSi20495]
MNLIDGQCPLRKQALRLQKQTQTYTLAVDAELARVKSAAFNYLK